MAASTPAASGGIFISYRREETAYPAGWIYDRLVEHYGRRTVFKDIDSLAPGDDYVVALTDAVAACDVLLAIIGTQWLTVTDADGKRRLDNPADFLRLEIEAALARHVLVVPVLIGGAKMPQEDELPPTLAPLTRRHAIELSPSHFDVEIGRLLRVLDQTLGKEEVPTAPPPPRPRRLSRRAGILAAAGAVVVLVPLAILAVTLGSGSSAKGAVFRDDFSSRASGWDDVGANRNGGHYANGGYRIYSKWSENHYGDVGLPRSAASVFPSAPRDVRVQVVARALQGTDQDAGYGIVCRADGNGQSYYQFGIWSNHVAIEKLTPDYLSLAQKDTTAVHPNGTNRMEASCVTEGAGVRLVFSVNGTVVATATDTKNPLAKGTVGLVVATDSSAKKPVEAEFDDFVVAHA